MLRHFRVNRHKTFQSFKEMLMTLCTTIKNMCHHTTVLQPGTRTLTRANHVQNPFCASSEPWTPVTSRSVQRPRVAVSWERCMSGKSSLTSQGSRSCDNPLDLIFYWQMLEKAETSFYKPPIEHTYIYINLSVRDDPVGHVGHTSLFNQEKSTVSCCSSKRSQQQFCI